jgi:hypothetical protein
MERAPKYPYRKEGCTVETEIAFISLNQADGTIDTGTDDEDILWSSRTNGVRRAAMCEI